MIPVYQTLTTANDGKGNCFMACVASIMEMPLRACPRLASDLSGGAFFRGLEDWLIPQGLFINRRSEPPKGWSITGGILVDECRTMSHAVVAFNGVPVHDPYPLGGTLSSDCEFYTIDPITVEQRPYCEDRLKEIAA